MVHWLFLESGHYLEVGLALIFTEVLLNCTQTLVSNLFKEAEDARTERRTHKALGSGRVVQKSNFQWYESVSAQINALLEGVGRPVPHMDTAAVQTCQEANTLSLSQIISSASSKHIKNIEWSDVKTSGWEGHKNWENQLTKIIWTQRYVKRVKELKIPFYCFEKKF